MKYMVNIYFLNDPNQFATREANDQETKLINGCKALDIAQVSTLCYEENPQGWLISFGQKGYLNEYTFSECGDTSDALKEGFKFLHSKVKEMTERLMKYNQTQLD